MTADDPVTAAQHAKENGMLNTDGWKNLRRTAKREKVLTRSVNQAKLRSFQVAPKFQHGHQVPRNCSEALALDRQNGNNKWKEAIETELGQLRAANSSWFDLERSEVLLDPLIVSTGVGTVGSGGF